MERHVHTFETVSHPAVTSEIKELGINAAEVRRCTDCQKEVVYVMTRKGKWHPLFDETQGSEQDILMA